MAFNYVVPANTFSDGDSDTLTYMATKADGMALPTWLSFNAGTQHLLGDAAGRGRGDGFGEGDGERRQRRVGQRRIRYHGVRHHPAHADQRHGCLEREAAIQFQFSENVQWLTLPPSTALTVTVDGSPVMTTSFTQLAHRARATIGVSPVIGQGQTVVATYTDPTAGDDAKAIQDTDGNDVATFTTGRCGVPAVTNNSTVDTTPPTLTSAIVNEAGQIIQLEFSENVDRSNRPLAASVTVTADGSAFTVTDVISGPNTNLKVLRVLVSPVIRQGQADVVAYEDPTGDDDT